MSEPGDRTVPVALVSRADGSAGSFCSPQAGARVTVLESSPRCGGRTAISGREGSDGL